MLPGRPLHLSSRLLDADGEPLDNWEIGLVDAMRVDPDDPAVTLESLLSAIDPTPRTDEHGRFRFEGFSRRINTAEARHPRTAVRLLGWAEAGTDDLVLRVPADSLRSVSGTVVSRAGTPVGGAVVGVAVFLDGGDSGRFVRGASAETDAEANTAALGRLGSPPGAAQPKRYHQW